MVRAQHLQTFKCSPIHVTSSVRPRNIPFGGSIRLYFQCVLMPGSMNLAFRITRPWRLVAAADDVKLEVTRKRKEIHCRAGMVIVPVLIVSVKRNSRTEFGFENCAGP